MHFTFARRNNRLLQMWREDTFFFETLLIFLSFFLECRVVYATFVKIYRILTENIYML
mgnify:CR=1|jgi:hypothetical protein